MKKIRYALFLLISIMIVISGCKKEENDNEPNTENSFTDIRDGKTYRTVMIGNQTWFAENLAFETPSGSIIYDDKSSNETVYGRLYNWTTANQAMPTGWHLPTKNDFIKLQTFLGGQDIAGGSLKETGNSQWAVPNEGATNSSGFAGLPGGYFDGNEYLELGFIGFFWSSKDVNSEDAVLFSIGYDDAAFLEGEWPKEYHFSVRCIKD